MAKDRMRGQLDRDLNGFFRNGLIGIPVAALGVVAFGVAGFLGAPWAVMVLAQAYFAGSMAYLSGLGYGILNDLIGCHVNLPYFLLGHQPQQASAVRSNDKTVNGIAWGILATVGLSIIAGIVFTVGVGIAGFAGASFAGFVMPLMALAIPVVVGIAHLVASNHAREREKKSEGLLDYRFYDVLIGMGGANAYQSEGLMRMTTSREDINGYLSNNDRNIFGFIVMPLLAIGTLISLITLGALGGLLPALLMGSTWSFIAPLVTGGLLTLLVGGAGLYAWLSQNKQVENRYRLDWPELNQSGASGESPKSSLDGVQQSLSNHCVGLHVQEPITVQTPSWGVTDVISKRREQLQGDTESTLQESLRQFLEPFPRNLADAPGVSPLGPDISSEAAMELPADSKPTL